MKEEHPKKENYAIAIDYLKLGFVKPNMKSFKGKAIAQAIGTEKFTLLELVPRDQQTIEILEKVYIGPGKRDKINNVKGKIRYEDLTATSRIEIEYAIQDIIKENEEKYVNFFNEAGAVSTRLHKLELIPGIGKKHREAIIKAREEKPFESFEDLTARVPVIADPIGMLVKRVILELDNSVARRGKNKYNLFTQVNRR